MKFVVKLGKYIIDNHCYSVGPIVVNLVAKQFDVYSVVLIKVLSLEVSARYVSDGMSL